MITLCAISPITPYTSHSSCAISPVRNDSLFIENPYVNKKPLVDRKILSSNDNINVFFDNISSSIFKNPYDEREFSNLLKYGFISLSSSCYYDLKNPSSAVGVKIEEGKDNYKTLDNFINDAKGIGVNFSEFKDPVTEIKKINEHFKTREGSVVRPPAGIALLNINHPKIKDFITLKDNANYNDWCFDLSVVIDDDFNDKETYNILLNSMLKKGEPGVIFSNKKDYICDSCAAAELAPNEGLTLAHINLGRFYNKQTRQIDYNLLKRSAYLLNKAMKTIDPNGYVGVLGYQKLLNNLNLDYGSDEALKVLENCLKVIKSIGAKTTIAPTGTISRVLNATPGIDSKTPDYKKELKTMALAQKFLDGQISKTLILDKNATINDVDFILTYAHQNGIKGICVFKK